MICLRFFLLGKYGKYLFDYDPFWRKKLEKDFPYYLKFMDKSYSYKSYYIYLFQMTKYMLEIFKDLKSKNLTQYSLLIYTGQYIDIILTECSKRNYLELIKYLIFEKHIDIFKALSVNFCDSIKYGNLNIIKFLHENGALSPMGKLEGLKNACFYGQLEIIKYLVENGADIHHENHKHMNLRNAVIYGHLGVVEYLLEKGYDVKENNIYLRWATFYEYTDIAKCLVRYGADAKDKICMFIAVENKCSELINYFVEQGGDISCVERIKTHPNFPGVNKYIDACVPNIK